MKFIFSPTRDMAIRGFISMALLVLLTIVGNVQAELAPTDGVKAEVTKGISKAAYRDLISNLLNPNDIDRASTKISSIIEWRYGDAYGTVISTEDSRYIYSSCSIFERVGNGKYEYMFGDPACHFIESARIIRHSEFSTIEMTLLVGQGYGSPMEKDRYLLFFDSSKSLFCSPRSKTDRFKCSKDPSNE
ncbi:hypothetical protein P3T40_006194 [Paraburkholderia sp. EB58]|jgi:hypothetical protein|uniref:hypothetical protein n=1 Tax=Paraburkholderia sp. EB58 TaxID=3035125 RepID=UPI003D24F9ED